MNHWQWMTTTTFTLLEDPLQYQRRCLDSSATSTTHKFIALEMRVIKTDCYSLIDSIMEETVKSTFNKRPINSKSSTVPSTGNKISVAEGPPMPPPANSWKVHKATLELHVKFTVYVKTDGMLVQPFSQNLKTLSGQEQSLTVRMERKTRCLLKKFSLTVLLIKLKTLQSKVTVNSLLT